DEPLRARRKKDLLDVPRRKRVAIAGMRCSNSAVNSGPAEPMRPWTNSEYARGALYGLVAVCVWAGFIVVSRLGVTTSLTPWDVAAIRFSVAGSLLLTYLLRHGLAFDRLGWTGLAAIIMGCGAPDGTSGQCRLAVRPCCTWRRFVSRRHAADGSNSRGGDAE